MDTPNTDGGNTFATDVYAFAMVCYEVSRITSHQEIHLNTARCFLGHTLFMILQTNLGSCWQYNRVKGHLRQHTTWAGCAVGVIRYYILLEPAGLTEPRDNLLFAKFLRNYVLYLTDLPIQGHLTHLTTCSHPRFCRIIHSLCSWMECSTWTICRCGGGAFGIGVLMAGKQQ